MKSKKKITSLKTDAGVSVEGTYVVLSLNSVRTDRNSYLQDVFRFLEKSPRHLWCIP